MSQKKKERTKELDRRRHRREERLKQRVRNAKAATKNKALTHNISKHIPPSQPEAVKAATRSRAQAKALPPATADFAFHAVMPNPNFAPKPAVSVYYQNKILRLKKRTPSVGGFNVPGAHVKEIRNHAYL